MEFFAILIVLAAVQLWGNGGSIQQDDWFARLNSRLSTLSSSTLRLGLALLLPAVVLSLLISLLGSMLYGLPLLILYVLVLLYSLGRGDFGARLDAYLDCWRRGDLEGAFEHALTLDDFDQSVNINNARELHVSVRKALLYQGFERWFGVIFWFVALGPVAALVYRLLFLLVNVSELKDKDRERAALMLYYVEWVPVRVLGFTFALVGDFDRSLTALREQFSSASPGSDLLDALGSLALSKPVPVGLVDGEEFAAAASVELNAAQALLFRSLLCWLVIVALLQMI